jgi:hypothetical protein
LRPYQGRLAIWGGANAVNGPVSHYLGLLAGELDQPDQAVTFFQDAVQLEERIGALPALARTLMCLSQTLLASDRTDRHATDMRGRAVALSERLEMRVLLRGLANRPDAWTLLQDGDGWLLEAGQEQARLPDVQGLRHLRTLLAAPGRDVSALDLVAGGRGLAAPVPTPVVDEQAIAAYRRRIAELEAELDAADATGDAEKAERAEQERAAMVAEVRRATGLGGRVRRTSAEAERARVNVTRTLRSALTRIAEQAPRAGAHLDASIRTGLACRYDPNPDGPSGWIV